MDDLPDKINAHLRTLRAADSQAKAVEWMTGAYRLMEACLEALKDRPAQVAHERLVFVPKRQRLEVVQSVSGFDIKAAEQRRAFLREKSLGQTVVYPEAFLHPGLKPPPKAWTRKDTLLLEQKNRIQRKGR